MSSTILYKFRSSTTFESLPLPGTSARLFDIKRAIVRAKKLDRSSTGAGMEFDFLVQNATTNEVYEDESMILPRGTRIVVRRVAADRGMGLLAKIARADIGGGIGGAGMGGGGASGGGGGAAAAPDNFYTIRSRDRDGEDEYLDVDPAPKPSPSMPSSMAMVDENKELEALKAVTDQAGSMCGSGMGIGVGRGSTQMSKVWSAGGGGGGTLAGMGPPNQRAGAMGGSHFKPHSRSRPNADPELREQEQRQQPQTKKRATGIPRTFLSLSATATDHAPDGAHVGTDTNPTEEEEGTLTSRLQPNTIAFQSLITHSGGQSSTSATGAARTLSHALKLTDTTIPDHLQCGVCLSLVKNAMLVPWDTEGRPACEECIRDALTINGFKCPLTGMEGVSPDDLLANVGLRKAAELFERGVMEKMDEIERGMMEEQERERKEMEERERKKTEERKNAKGDVMEEAGDRGVMMTRKEKMKKPKGDDYLFEGEEDFGGDVFDVASDNAGFDETDPSANENVQTVQRSFKNSSSGIDMNSSTVLDNTNKTEKDNRVVSEGQGGTVGEVGAIKGINDEQRNESLTGSQLESGTGANASDSAPANEASNENGATGTANSAVLGASSRQAHFRKDVPKRRGPPAGYVLGPAGGGGIMNASVIPPMSSFPVPPAGGPPGVPGVPGMPGVPGVGLPGMNVVPGISQVPQGPQVTQAPPMAPQGDVAFGNVLPPPPPPPPRQSQNSIGGMGATPDTDGRGRNGAHGGHAGGRSGGRFSQTSRGHYPGGRGGRKSNVNSNSLHNPQQQQQYSNHRAQQHGYRDFNRGGRQGGQGRGFRRQDQESQWGNNSSGGDWNRKRHREAMEGSNIMQDTNQGGGGGGGGGWGGGPNDQGYNNYRGNPQYSGGYSGGRGQYEGGGGRGRSFGRGRYGGGGRGGGEYFRGRGGRY